MQQTSDGGYIIVGYAPSAASQMVVPGGGGDDDVWLIKTDSAGNKEWDKTFGGGDYDWGYSVLQTPDDGYIIAGVTLSYGRRVEDGSLIRTDSIGETVRDRTFDRLFLGGGTTNGWLIKTDSSGDKVWDRTIGSLNIDTFHSVEHTSGGGYIVGGTARSWGNSYRAWLVKVNAFGGEEWHKMLGGEEVDQCFSIRQTSDGGYILVGPTSSYGAGDEDGWLIKTDSSGDKVWDITFGGSDEDIGWAVVQTLDGGYAVAGTTMSYGGEDSDVWLVKVKLG